MIDPHITELMNMELDGVLSPRERAELQRYLAAEPEAGVYFDGLRKTLNAVDKWEDQEPPAHLVDRVMAVVQRERRFVDTGGEGLAARLRKWLFSPRWRYGAAFAGGLVVGLGVYALIGHESGPRDDRLDVSNFWGTMKYFDHEDGFEQTEFLGVDLAEVRGRMSLHESEAILMADVALESEGEIEWVLEYDAKEVSFDGYRCFNGTRGSVVAGKTEMRVRQSGETHYLLFFTQKDRPVRPLRVRIYSGDRLLLERPLVSSDD